MSGPQPRDSDLYLLLGRIDGKLDAALARLEKHEKRLGHFELRISALEQSRAYVLGICLSVALLGPILLDIAKSFLFGPQSP